MTTNAKTIQKAGRLLKSGHTIQDTAQKCGVHRGTVGRWLRKDEGDPIYWALSEALPYRKRGRKKKPELPSILLPTDENFEKLYYEQHKDDISISIIMNIPVSKVTEWRTTRGLFENLDPSLFGLKSLYGLSQKERIGVKRKLAKMISEEYEEYRERSLLSPSIIKSRYIMERMEDYGWFVNLRWAQDYITSETKS